MAQKALNEHCSGLLERPSISGIVDCGVLCKPGMWQRRCGGECGSVDWGNRNCVLSCYIAGVTPHLSLSLNQYNTTTVVSTGASERQSVIYCGAM